MSSNELQTAKQALLQSLLLGTEGTKHKSTAERALHVFGIVHSAIEDGDDMIIEAIAGAADSIFGSEACLVALFDYIGAVIARNTNISRRCNLLKLARHALVAGRSRGLSPRAFSKLNDILLNLLQLVAGGAKAVEAVKDEVASWREGPISSTDEDVGEVITAAEANVAAADVAAEAATAAEKAKKAGKMSFSLKSGTKRPAAATLPRPSKRRNLISDEDEDAELLSAAAPPAVALPWVDMTPPTRLPRGVRESRRPGSASRVRRAVGGAPLCGESDQQGLATIDEVVAAMVRGAERALVAFSHPRDVVATGDLGELVRARSPTATQWGFNPNTLAATAARDREFGSRRAQHQMEEFKRLDLADAMARVHAMRAETAAAAARGRAAGGPSARGGFAPRGVPGGGRSGGGAGRGGMGKCYTCGGFGHLARDCPNSRGTGPQGPPRGSSGHRWGGGGGGRRW